MQTDFEENPIKLSKRTDQFLIEATLKHEQISIDLTDYVCHAAYSGNFKKESIHMKADLSNIFEALSVDTSD